jgi:hypothetical protein
MKKRFTKYPQGYVKASTSDSAFWDAQDDNTYGCDGCGERFDWDDINWFTSSIGFCNKCYDLLHRRVPSSVLDFCYDRCEGGDNEIAQFIIEQAQ